MNKRKKVNKKQEKIDRKREYRKKKREETQRQAKRCGEKRDAENSGRMQGMSGD